MRMCVRARVSGWRGVLDISVAGVRLKRLHSFHIKAKPEKHTIHILHPAHSFVGSNFRLTRIQAEQVVRYLRKNGHLILVNCL